MQNWAFRKVAAYAKVPLMLPDLMLDVVGDNPDLPLALQLA